MILSKGKIIAVLTSLALLAGACSRSSEEIKRNAILAKINDKIVTVGEFEDFFAFRLGAATQGVKEADLIQLKYKILNDYIDEEIILEVARREKIEVNDYQLEEELRNIIGQYGEEHFQDYIKKAGLTRDRFKEFLRRYWLIRLVEEQKVYNNINVTNKEILKYYADNQDDYTHSESIEVKELDFATLEEANAVTERLKAGEKFDDIYVTLTGQLDESGTRIYTRDDLPENYAKELFALRTGGVSQILEDEYGRYHLFKVEKKVYAKKISLSEVEATIKQIILLKKRELRYDQWINSLKKRSYDITINENYFKR
ncbi:peptidyl-prolyl cis-trans isomerase [Candidatus Mcinerneyibacteriota bacterium]|nr:peptidyl-prolyl cis-trans isomerase [Candidatus Mcinerneyibacteriota bacterium]